jgi:hypothetical protein
MSATGIAPQTADHTPDHTPDQAAGEARACGWFDSSHELAAGLAVIEHRGFDALPAGLPLGWQMAAWNAALPAAQRAGAW